MEIQNLKNILEGYPKFRLKQVYDLIFKNLINSWNKATNLPKDIKKLLQKKFPLEIKAKEQKTLDKNSLKASIELEDGKIVETVLMKHKDGRNTVCVSSQIGCPLGCLFCATGKMKFARNLEANEIIMQILYFARLLKKENQKVTNIVFMGMGEPFLNYDEVMKAIKIINNKDRLNIGARKISISTVGIIDGIKKLSKEPMQINLAISLHAPNDKLRSEIIPINKKYPLKKLIQACQNYIEKTNRRIMFEYILIKGLNDSPKHAKELAVLLKENFKNLYIINLIKYNDTKKFKSSSTDQIKIFEKILKENDIPFVERYRFGDAIDAACGQLASK